MSWAVLTYSNSNTQGTPWVAAAWGFGSQAEASAEASKERFPTDGGYRYVEYGDLSAEVAKLNAPYAPYAGDNAQNVDRGLAVPNLTSPEIGNGDGGLFEEQYRILIEMPSVYINVIDTSMGRRIIRGFLNRQGWDDVYFVGNGNRLEIMVAPIGTAPIIFVVLGVIALIFAVIGLYFGKYSIVRVSDNKVAHAAEVTEQEVINALENIYKDSSLPVETRDAAAKKLIELSSPAVTEPAKIPEQRPQGDEGIGIGMGIALLAGAYILTQNKR